MIMGYYIFGSETVNLLKLFVHFIQTCFPDLQKSLEIKSRKIEYIFFQNPSAHRVHAVPTFRPKRLSNQALELSQNSGMCNVLRHYAWTPR